MPTVPTVDAPTQSASGSPLSISAPSEAFGGNVAAEGLAKLGKAAGDESDLLARHAEQFQAINNKAAADAAFVTQLQGVDKLAADYQANNRGIAAFDNLPVAYKALADQREKIGATLTSPMARAMYDEQSRRATANVTGELTRFAVSQRKDYVVKQIGSVADSAAASATPENFDAQMDVVAKQLAVMATPQVLGWSPEEYAAKVREVRGKTAYNVTAGIAPKDPTAAQAFYDAHKEDMTPQERTQTEAVIRSAASNITVASIADEYTARAANSGAASSYLDAVHGREGTGKNPASSATGPGQFIDKTWLKLMKSDPQFADDVKGKSDAEILALRNNAPMADRAILAYRELNADYLTAHNLPTNNATLGLAHGYGPEGAVKILQASADTPIESIIGKHTAEINRVGGMTTGQVRQQFDARFGTGGDKLDAMESNAKAGYDAIAADPRLHGDPTLINRAQSQYLTNINQARALDNLANSAAKERLLGAALQGNLTDPAALQQSYPGAMEDWTKLSASSQRTLTTQLTAAGNAWNAEKTDRYNQLVGMRENNIQAFLHTDLSKEDLPLSAVRALSTDQQKIIAKQAKQTETSANLQRALGNEFVKQGIATSGLKKDTPDYDHFTGALYAEVETWAENHPGKKPTDMELGSMAAGVLAKRTVPATWIFGKTTMQQPGYAIPEGNEKELSAQFKSHYGRDPTAAEVAYFYHKANAK